MSYKIEASKYLLGYLIKNDQPVFSNATPYDVRQWLEENDKNPVYRHPQAFEDMVSKGQARYRKSEVDDYSRSMWTLLVLILSTLLASCGMPRASHVAHLTPETSVLGEEMYDTNARYDMQSVYPDYENVDVPGFFNSQSSLQDSLEQFFELSYEGSPYHDLNTYEVEEIVLKAENVRHKEIKRMYRKISKEPTDSYLFEWWFLLNYRPYFILEHQDTKEISYIVFQEDKGYVWLRGPVYPDKVFWMEDAYPPVYWKGWGPKKRIWIGEPSPLKNNNNPVKHE